MVKNSNESSTGKYDNLGIEISLINIIKKTKYTRKTSKHRIFSMVKETLERIGICNKQTKSITPSCYITREGKKYKLYHFKELLVKNGFLDTLNENDYARRDSIATMLENWNMIHIKDRKFYRKETVPIFVLKSNEKKNYEICHKFHF